MQLFLLVASGFGSLWGKLSKNDQGVGPNPDYDRT